MKGFWRYFAKKFFWYFFTFIIALFLNFLLPRLIPGNPVDLLLAGMLSGMRDINKATEIRQQTYMYFGLDKSIIEVFHLCDKVFDGGLAFF